MNCKDQTTHDLKTIKLEIEIELMQRTIEENNIFMARMKKDYSDLNGN